MRRRYASVSACAGWPGSAKARSVAKYRQPRKSAFETSSSSRSNRPRSLARGSVAPANASSYHARSSSEVRRRTAATRPSLPPKCSYSDLRATFASLSSASTPTEAPRE